MKKSSTNPETYLAIVCALQPEAQPIIKHFKLKKKLDYTHFEVFQNSWITLIISGIGCLQSAAATSYLYHILPKQASYVINFGTAGHNSLLLGTLCSAHKLLHPSFPKSFFPQVNHKINLKSLPVQSLDRPSSEYREDILYDMEAYGFFSAAINLFSLEKLLVLKLISDNSKQPCSLVKPSRIKSLVDQSLSQVDSIFNLLTANSPLSNFDKSTNAYLLFQPNYSFSERKQLGELQRKISLLEPKYQFKKEADSKDFRKTLLSLKAKLHSLSEGLL